VENSLSVSQKINHSTAIYDPTISLQSINVKELKAMPCTLMFTKALFTIAKRQEQLKCPSTDE
jgi:hypothetical protein